MKLTLREKNFQWWNFLKKCRVLSNITQEFDIWIENNTKRAKSSYNQQLAESSRSNYPFKVHWVFSASCNWQDDQLHRSSGTFYFSKLKYWSSLLKTLRIPRPFMTDKSSSFTTMGPIFWKKFCTQHQTWFEELYTLLPLDNFSWKIFGCYYFASTLSEWSFMLPLWKEFDRSVQNLKCFVDSTLVIVLNLPMQKRSKMMYDRAQDQTFYYATSAHFQFLQSSVKFWSVGYAVEMNHCFYWVLTWGCQNLWSLLQAIGNFDYFQ